MGDRYLVTGAEGFIGRAVMARLAAILREDDRLLGVDRRGAFPVDLMDPDRVKALVEHYGPTRVLHLAGATAGSEAELWIANVETTRVLLGALPQSCRVVVASSAAVYGLTQAADCPLAPDRTRAPVSTYGRSKREQEQAVMGRAVIARIFNVCGPGQHAHLMPAALIRSLRADGQATIWRADSRRDWLDVRDVAAALVSLAMRECGRMEPIYNIGGGEGLSNLALARMTALALGMPDAPLRAEYGSADCSVADVTGLRRLGWVPQVALATSLRDMAMEG
jgi:nucleoside-diphosphate-sugar epimerase